jgi:quinol-cytochrome oxidoreductase complex cytochrome b subunit
MSAKTALPSTEQEHLHRPFHAVKRWKRDFAKAMSDRVLESRLGFRKTWYLGALTLGAFTIQIATGLLLMLYYHPSIPQAYADMKDLEFVISSGTLLRSLHRWSAHAMVFLVFVHMAKVFYRAAYRPPRELNWVLGVCLLMLTLLLSYTGYLLPWDQLSYWGTTVGANIISSMPWLGPKLRFYMLGGHTVNANALLRFYVLHTMILPLGLIALLGVHLWRLHKDGGMYEVDDHGRPVLHGKTEEENKKEAARLAGERTLSYGDLLFREVTAIEGLAVVLFTMGLIWVAPLEQLANPMHTPNPAKAPWYFTGLQELLHYFPPFVAGIILPSLILTGLFFVPFSPFFDSVKTREAIDWLRSRPVRWLIGGILIVAVSALLIRVHAWDALLPVWIFVGLNLFAAAGSAINGNRLCSWLLEKPISFWTMTLFLMEAVVLTAVGTFFRGPGWAWVWPWRV